MTIFKFDKLLFRTTHTQSKVYLLASIPCFYIMMFPLCFCSALTMMKTKQATWRVFTLQPGNLFCSETAAPLGDLGHLAVPQSGHWLNSAMRSPAGNVDIFNYNPASHRRIETGLAWWVSIERLGGRWEIIYFSK